jgi:hypothetical protein
MVRPPKEAASFAHFLFSVATTLRVHTREPLIRRFDDVLANYFDCLISLRCEILPRIRVLTCLRLLQAVPLADTHALGSCPHNGDNSAGRAKTPTAGGFLLGLKRGIIWSNSSGIEHFTLTDSVGLRFGLSVQPLDGCSSDGRASDERDSYLVIRFHRLLPV